MAHAHLLSVPVIGLPQGKTQAFSSAPRTKARAAGRASTTRSCSGPGLTLADGAVATARSIVADDRRPARGRCRRAQRARRRAGPDLVTRRRQPVLTPHPGELGRLLGTGGRCRPEATGSPPPPSSRADRALCVLKGAGTVISGGGRQVDQPVRRRPHSRPRAPATCSPASSGRCSRKGSRRSRQARSPRTCTGVPVRRRLQRSRRCA